jgi:hypothetical protein
MIVSIADWEALVQGGCGRCDMYVNKYEEGPKGTKKKFTKSFMAF